MRPIKLLLIEDNEGDILLTKEAFEQSKLIAQIDVVKDGMAGIDYFKHILEDHRISLPELVLLDINLPKKNGQEVLQFIKGNEILKQIPVIMLTTSSSDNDIINSYKNQANCYIMKPVDINTFMSVISKIEDFWLATAKLPFHKR
jgi:CheY-like chemotaxis protein